MSLGASVCVTSRQMPLLPFTPTLPSLCACCTLPCMSSSSFIHSFSIIFYIFNLIPEARGTNTQPQSSEAHSGETCKVSGHHRLGHLGQLGQDKGENKATLPSVGGSV